MISRTYRELSRLHTLEERFRYLSLGGSIGESTFGFDRYVNQQFYRSREWRHIRNDVIARDQGCDLGIEGYEIHSTILVHHMEPIDLGDIRDATDYLMDPNHLITTTQRTHNAIHFGDERLLPRLFVARAPGDTKLW